MGEWRVDQSKHARRYVWGTTRGMKDPVWRDFEKRLKEMPDFKDARHEKIGGEVHLSRLAKDPNGKPFWLSFLRFVDDTWGYWTVYWKVDERRWRATHIEELPVGKALLAAAEFYRSKQNEFL